MEEFFPPGTGRRGEKEQLASELQMIEHTIRDREREIRINQIHIDGADDPDSALDYGSYVSQGLVAGGRTGGITTTAKSGQVPRSKGRFFEPF